MENSDLITIIVPVYNVEKYFERCIESILGQTYTTLQIILIDDGSTDKSGELCDKFAAKDDRIEVFHQEHQGVASARNVGLNHCKGDYIGFVDSDDWIEQEMFESMLKALKEHDVDAVRCNFNVVREEIKSKYIANPTPKMLSGRDAISDTLAHGKTSGYGTIVWNTLFKREKFFAPNLLCFDTSMTLGEDADVLRRYLLRSNTVLFLENCYYNYNKDNVRSVTRSTTAYNFLQSVDSKIDFLESNHFSDEEIMCAKKQRENHLILIDILEYISNVNKEVNAIRSVNVFKYFSALDCPVLSRIKLSIVIFMIKMRFSPKFVGKIWNIHR